MREDEGLNEESGGLLVQTLELVLIVFGLAVLHSFGWTLLMPMVVAFFISIPCAFAMKLMQRIRQ